MKTLNFFSIAIVVLLVSGYLYLTKYQDAYEGQLAWNDKKILIFDFGGTLCDSLEAAINAFNNMPAFLNLQRVAKNNVDAYRQVPTLDFFKAYGVTSLKLPLVLFLTKRSLKKIMPTLSAFSGMKEILQDLKKKGYTIGIITSNSLENVNAFFIHNQMPSFDFIYSAGSFFGKHEILEKIIRKSSGCKFYYIGDEMRDIKAAKISGISSVAVSWGYHNKDLLKTANPDYVIESPSDLRKLFLDKNF